jgi:hypothetical protein
VWSDDEEQVADFVNAVRLAAQATFGTDQQSVVFSGTGVWRLRSSLDDVTWRSANVRGRIKLDE